MRLKDLKREHPDLFWVTRTGYERVLPKLEKMARKAAKLGCEMPEVIIEQEAVVPRTIGHPPYTRQVMVPYVGVIMRGSEVVLGGWKFVAVVQHTAKGNIMHRPFGDREMPIPKRYRSTTTELCEHCHTRRKRNDTYLVLHVDDGIWKQVGKTCLRDHCGGHDPAKALFAADAPRRISGWFGSEDTPEKWEPLVDTVQFIRDCVTAGRMMGGFVTVKQAKATGQAATAPIVWDAHFNCDSSSVTVWNTIHEKQTEEDLKVADAARAWAIDIDPRVESQYYSDLRTACTLDQIPYRNVNLVASVIPAHREDLTFTGDTDDEGCEKLTPTDMMVKGQRYSFGVVRLYGVRSFTKYYGDREVVRYIAKFRDRLGRRLGWFTDDPLDSLKRGDDLVLSGEFDRLNYFRDQEEVLLSECRWRRIGEPTELEKAQSIISHAAARLGELSEALEIGIKREDVLILVDNLRQSMTTTP